VSPAWALPAAALVIACRELLVSAVRVEGGWSGSGCSIVAGAGGLVGAPRQGSTNGSLHTSGQCSPTVTRRDVRNELGEWVTDEKSSLPAERKAVAFASSSEPCDAGAMALVRRNSALKERELRGTRDLLNAETAFRPGRAVTENMKLNMAGSGDLIGGQQNPPSRLPGGVKLGGCYRNPGGTMLQFG
jgi:hypothetical protein